MSNGIARADGRTVLLKSGGNTGDIIKVVLSVIPEVRTQTEEFSRRFTPDRSGMRDLWWFVKSEIHYNVDPLGVQWVREPARLWQDREGDCKSFTVFIVSVLENLGLEYKIRFVNTEKPGSRIVNHVYPVAILPNGEQIIMDAVYDRFNAEHRYYYKKDYAMSEIYRLSGIGSTDQAEIEKYHAEIIALGATIPDTVLVDDITTMTRGEFSRFQQVQFFTAQAETATDEGAKMRFSAAAAAVQTGNVSGLAGIGNYTQKDINKISRFLDVTRMQTAPAFPAPILALPDNLSGLGALGDKIKDLASDVLNVWKKVLNWMFKEALPKAAPFFLYAFIKKSVGPKTNGRKARQTNVLNWIQKVGKFDDPGDVLNAVKTGIVKTFGKTPEQVLNLAAKGNVAGIGVAVAAVITAVTAIVEIVSKIATIFKKRKEDAAASVNDAPDFDELSNELAMSGSTNITPGTTTSSSGGNDNQMIMLAALGLGAVLLLKNT